MIYALRAEILKYRRTSTLIITLGIPLIITLLGFFVFLNAKNISQDIGQQEILAIINSTSTSLWINMALPMIIGVLASQVVGIEQDHLKHILIQPVARWQIYITKILAVLAFIGLSSLALVIGGGLIMLSAQILDAALLLNHATKLLSACLGALPLMIIGISLAFRFKGPLAIGTAILGTMIGPLLLSHQYAWKFFPWSLSLALNQQNDLAPWLILAFTLFLTAIGLWIFSKYEPR